MLDSVSEILRLQSAGEASAVEIASAALDRIETADGTINAFTHLNRELTLAAAADVDRRRSAGETLGPLAGVPVAVKDVLCTHDMPTTCSSKMLHNFHPPYDSGVVEKLRAADAVIVGKTNMDEFAMGASTENSAFGVTKNPWDTTRIPGGSSGGAAACVAASMVPISLGTDTGGSIRQPAAMCGVTGLKPTYGRVSRYGLIAFASSLDQVGPIGWSVQDIAPLMETIAGHDKRDSTSLNLDVGSYVDAIKGTDLTGIKIGMLRESMEAEGVDPTIKEAVKEAAKVFEKAGAELIDINLPHSEYWVPTYYVIAPSEASSNLSRYDGAHYGHRAADIETGAELGPLVTTYCRSRDEGFGAEVKRRIMLGTYALSEGYADDYYNKALKVRRLIKSDFDAAFSQVDLLLGPVTPTAAFPLGSKVDDPIQMYLCDLFTTGANLAGIPALSLPAGKDADGLPIAIQLQAPALEESRLLFAGSVFQLVTDHHTDRPNTERPDTTKGVQS
ncbi:Glutamyl-tRNA(Gln) amidotransferase subunit A [Rubripirellula obstinata]|uniref:Glutamyl-tRNA(Gln) amidotransferase subunit A n=1 Tax=Rubripirellula obstinata TaxID=406547 RepID=A0A5B1CJP4_9BACT|nr:Asp-tRNA(Asn)/Glu-tRNA(Gln) amidotransferase subunit GatA [Rubripirellula obstinata]KAA1260502.1 Glutamyl-tRNA(Gln) amidotransferase subunit A [Rubripirellula obstinata]